MKLKDLCFFVTDFADATELARTTCYPGYIIPYEFYPFVYQIVEIFAFVLNLRFINLLEFLKLITLWSKIDSNPKQVRFPRLFNLATKDVIRKMANDNSGTALF